MDRKKFKKKSSIQQFIEDAGTKIYFYGAVAVLFTLYTGGILTQITRMNFLEESNKVSVNPFIAIAANTESLRGLFIVLVFYLSVYLFFYFRNKDKNARDLTEDSRGFSTDGSSEYGQNKIMKENEARDYFEIEPYKIASRDDFSGFYVGKIVPEDNPKAKLKDKGVEAVIIPDDGKRICRAKDGRRMVRTIDGQRRYEKERMVGYSNSHIMAIGPSGSGKSYTVSLTNIFNYINKGHSIIVTDPKGELYSLTQWYAQQHGYVVKVLNLQSPQYSDSWDVLGELEKTADSLDIEILDMCQLIIDNTGSPDGKDDEAHKSGALNLLTALMFFIMLEMPRDKRQLGTVMDLLEYDDDTLNAMFEDAVHDLPKKPWRTYYGGSQAFRGNLRAGLANRLKTLQLDSVRQMTGVSDIDILLPGRQKCIYYCVMEDVKSTLKFISSLFFSNMVNSLLNDARRKIDGRLDIPVHFILDEFATIGVLPDFDRKLAMVRSAGMSMVLIFQTLTQIQALYPTGWETLVANCGTLMCLRCVDLTTADYLSKRAGTSTINVEQMRMARPIMDVMFVPTEWQISEGVNKRETITVGEVLTFAEDEVLVFANGADAFFVKKLPYPELVDNDEILEHRKNVNQNAPLWREKQRLDATKFAREMPITESYQESRSARTRKNQPDVRGDIEVESSMNNQAKEVEKQTRQIDDVGERIDEAMAKVANELFNMDDTASDSQDDVFDNLNAQSSFKDYDPNEESTNMSDSEDTPSGRKSIGESNISKKSEKLAEDF